MRKQQKEAKYQAACRAEGIEFFALPVDTTGAWEEGAPVIITKLGRALACASCQDEGQVVWHLFSKLSILLMNMNACMILNRVHPDPSTNWVMKRPKI